MRPLIIFEIDTVISSRDNSNVPTSARGDLEHAVSTLFERIATKECAVNGARSRTRCCTVR